jgi:hypothetical protein
MCFTFLHQFEDDLNQFLARRAVVFIGDEKAQLVARN